MGALGGGRLVWTAGHRGALCLAVLRRLAWLHVWGYGGHSESTGGHRVRGWVTL